MKKLIIQTLSVLLVTILTAGICLGQESLKERPIMRFPDIHDSLVVFCYGGDIWKASVSGGVAVRLTIHDGEELYPRFSPDGSMIAFTGQYDGNSDIYVMNLYGGEIKRLTYHPWRDRMIGWHPVLNKVIFQSSRNGYANVNTLFMVSPDGTDLEQVQLYEVSYGSFSPDGSKIAYNKISREGRTWKRYKGGTAQDIYLYDFETRQMEQLTFFEGTDRLPMWIGDKIYFSSDRDKTLNLYSYDLETAEINKLTNHSEYDIRRPAEGENKIVYELGGSLWILNVTSGETNKIPITIKTDLPERRPYFTNVQDYISDFDCSPSGERAVITARGDIYSVPSENGAIINMTKSSGARDRGAVWSPDGKKIAYLSDASGEYEIYVIDSKADLKAEKLTDHQNGYRQNLRWSPDSKKIAFSDQSLSFYVLDVESRKITKVDKAEFEHFDVSLDVKQIYDYAWSPDSRYIAYSKMDETQIFKIYIYSLESGQINCVSDGRFNDFNPVFTKDGKHLLFISNRHFNPTFCDFDWEMVYKDLAGIYGLTLTSSGDPLLPLQSDEAEKQSNVNEKENPGDLIVRIDFNGLKDRIEEIPLGAGNYRNLAINDTHLFYLNAEEGDFNRFEFRSLPDMTLYSYSIADRSEKTVIKDIDCYRLSADGSAIIYKKSNDIGIVSSNSIETNGENIDFSDLETWIDPLEEWMQIYNEVWRMERDFFYDPGMHGLDWDVVGEKYRRLVPYASYRTDLTYLIGELIGELNSSHTYAYEGDKRRTADNVNVGLLGADFEIDKQANRYRFKKIFRHSDWTRNNYPPLAVPGLNVSEGDYLLAVNGDQIYADKNLLSYFQGLAGKQAKLMIGNKSDLSTAREIVVKPNSGDWRARYLEWVENNRKIVEEASGGKIGYIHFPDTYTGSAQVFPYQFYPQSRKQGIIVDGRYNAGGLGPEIFLYRLGHRTLSYWSRRYSHDQTSPTYACDAHLVCLTNKYAGSGGDELPHQFQIMNLGPVIGTRTWGGLTGISMYVDLVDGGYVSVPDYRIYDENGNWVVEGVGVEPDIIVEIDPASMEDGYDTQLMRAVGELMRKINQSPIEFPEHETFPSQN